MAQFSFWGNYLPRVYPVHLRGTGESFAANIGGRMIGTCFAWVTSTSPTSDAWGSAQRPDQVGLHRRRRRWGRSICRLPLQLRAAGAGVDEDGDGGMETDAGIQ